MGFYDDFLASHGENATKRATNVEWSLKAIDKADAQIQNDVDTKADKSDTYTKSEVDNKLGTMTFMPLFDASFSGGVITTPTLPS